MSQILIFMLMINAACVSVGLMQRLDMWPWVVVYWIILTAKNGYDLFDSIRKQNKTKT